VFSDRMTYLVFSPYWNVPQSIATKEILFDLRSDPEYLTKNNMKVFVGFGSDAKEIDPASVNWQEISASSFPYRFRQEPGPGNPLGRVKFMFPNKFNVYLHDTPSRGLFTRTVRAFSHGCIRIERPLELAEYLLAEDPRWNRQRILEAMDLGTEQTVPIPISILVHVLYWTAWADENGSIFFRDDIYGRDALLWEALRERPPQDVDVEGQEGKQE
jgi:murein L,D-transpeptidase YcbB/YkuD